nr:ras-like GTP-binding protein O-RHO [Aotus nancymaae]
MAPIRKKLVTVGGGVCGEMCLLIVLSKDQFPEGFAPRVFQNYVAHTDVDGNRKTSRRNGAQKSSISVPACSSSWLGTRGIFGMMCTQGGS